MSGIQEILVLALILLAIFLLPRILRSTSERQEEKISWQKRARMISGRLRLAIVVSALWPLVVALYTKPWLHGWVVFLLATFGPLLSCWGIGWVIRGFLQDRRR
ncbi:MAG: hypothetical protein GY874_12095 [Desulfobacteraceae bacterium]|nr:hypothetical protein [Desulfobacteraceae bacterium]